MEQQSLIELTADIVSSHVTNNHVSVGDLPHLIQRVHEALAGLSAPKVDEPAQKSPVVSVRASIRPDYLVCLECGRKQKTLKRHLATAHRMTPEQYRADYGLPRGYPMVAPNYSERRSTMAKAIGLGRKPGSGTAVSVAAPPDTQAASKPPKAPARRGRKTVAATASPDTEAALKAPKASTRRARRKTVAPAAQAASEAPKAPTRPARRKTPTE